jgi:hypothetical protein
MNYKIYCEKVYSELEADLGIDPHSSTGFSSQIIEHGLEYAKKRWENYDEQRIDQCVNLIKILYMVSAYNREVTEEEKEEVQKEHFDPVDPPRIDRKFDLKIPYLLFSSIEQKTKQLRHQFFDQTDPPFQFYEGAIDWLIHEAETSEETEGKILREEIKNKVEEYEQKFGAVDVDFSTYEIEHLDLDSDSALPDEKSIRVGAGSDLIRLKEYLSDTADRFNCNEHAVFIYFALGLKPLLPKLQVELDDPPLRGSLPEWNITIKSSQISMDILRDAHKSLTDLRKQSSNAPDREEDQILVDAVITILTDELGEGGGTGKDNLSVDKERVPHDTMQEFWEDVLDYCEERGVDIWNGPDGPMMRWRTLMSE